MNVDPHGETDIYNIISCAQTTNSLATTADDTQRILLSHTYIDDHDVPLSSDLEVMVKFYDTACLEVFIP